MTKPTLSPREEFEKLFTSDNPVNKTETGTPFLDYWETDDLWNFHLKALREAQIEMLEGIRTEFYRVIPNFTVTTGIMMDGSLVRKELNKIRDNLDSKIKSLREEK